MLFTSTLSYPDSFSYPEVDIASEAFLKKTFLYFDELRMIVPESTSAYISSSIVRTFQDSGFLVPLRINPEMEEIKAVSEDVLTWLNSPIGRVFLIKNQDRTFEINFGSVQRAVTTITNIHPNELPDGICGLLSMMSSQSPSNTEWLQINDSFAHFYMTLFANRLSERIGVPLITPFPYANRLAWLARLDSPVKNSGIFPVPLRELQYAQEYAAFGLHTSLARSLAPSNLVQIAIPSVVPASNTSIETLKRFKRSRIDELLRLRTEIEDMVSVIRSDLPGEARLQKLSHIYTHELQPTLDNLKKALDDVGIRWITEGILNIHFLSNEPSSLAGLPIGANIFTSEVKAKDYKMTVSISSVGALYNVEKRSLYIRNPYTYLW